MTIWSRLQHRNVLPFLGLVDLSGENMMETGLVSPWVKSGNVTDYLQKNPGANRVPMVRVIIVDV